MFHNLKVDVIYYKTNTDFEMEFNLCGCCRMRLLTDKAPDKKTTVMSLARAVSRSQVIIVVGNLFGGDGIINLTAGAIGKNVSLADNKTYGITSDEKIEIINGSIPLVTSEGYFGGCIIESGPQTLILLSENKNIRKSVLKSLIHPYLEELNTEEFPAKEDNDIIENDEIQEPINETEDHYSFTLETDTVSNQTAPETDDALDEPTSDDEPVLDSESEETEIVDEDSNESIEETLGIILDSEASDEGEYTTEELNDIILTEDDEEENILEETDDIIISNEIDSDLIFEDETISIKEFVMRNEQYYNETESVDDLITYDEDSDFIFQKPSRLNMSILLISILLLILIASLCFCIFYGPSKDGVSVSVYLKEIVNTLFG